MDGSTPAWLVVFSRAIADWWDDWVALVVLNLAWLLCWITVLLGPPATFGLYYAGNRLAQGESVGLSGLVEGGRRYFLASWLWFLGVLAVSRLLLLNVTFYQNFDQWWAGILQVSFLALLLVWLFIQFYTIPFMLEQKRKNLLTAWRNGLFTTLAAPGYSLVMAIASLVVLASLVLIAPLFLGGPPFLAMLGNHAVRERLEAFGVRER